MSEQKQTGVALTPDVPYFCIFLLCFDRPKKCNAMGVTEFVVMKLKEIGSLN
jgi:hypothetical protein